MLKSSKEKATKGRLCRCCNKHGVSHDKRDCPVLLYSDPNLHLDSSESSKDSDADIQHTEVGSICCSGIWRWKCTKLFWMLCRMIQIPWTAGILEMFCEGSRVNGFFV
ncbi:hypothetical protein AAC387_Pa06g2327 [Persea americana]